MHNLHVMAFLSFLFSCPSCQNHTTRSGLETAALCYYWACIWITLYNIWRFKWRVVWAACPDKAAKIALYGTIKCCHYKVLQFLHDWTNSRLIITLKGSQGWGNSLTDSHKNVVSVWLFCSSRLVRCSCNIETQ